MKMYEYLRSIPTSVGRAAIAALVCAALLGGAASETMAGRFSSPEAAYLQGMDAYRSGAYDRALPALEEAARAGIVEARFFLARVRADDSSPHVDHAKAYNLYLAIVDEYATIDRSDPGAPFVSKSLIALAHYLRRGLPDANVAPNMPRALQYLDHAAKYFGDGDAQFEIAKLYLSGEGLPKDTELALHWLSTLTRDGHPGAQAVLADLFWRGDLVKRDQVRALGLVSLAMEQAPETDHFWIADTYQNIYCNSNAGTRKSAEDFIVFWRPRFGPIGSSARERTSLGTGGHRLSAIRTCGNGELVPVRKAPAMQISPRPERPTALPSSAPPATNQDAIRPGGFMLRETGAETPQN